ncbi:MAG: TetR family transcriptional regulator [Frankiales bacterium]|nr:TetR family transcriptional regulator [Frankiales bacterium]
MPVRERYHHGDLRAALVTAALAAARAGGEPAVRLNQLAAQVGVSASAAYRHFPDGLEGLLGAVGDVGRAELAARIEQRTGQARGAVDRFRASGEAYVEYVTEQPGLFQVTCRHDSGLPGRPDPHGLLEACLDDLVADGALPAERRPYASAAAWAAVHGLAVLLVEGPLRSLPEGERRSVVDRTLDMVARGL